MIKMYQIIHIALNNSKFYFRNEYQYIKLPVDIDDAKNLGRVLARYQERYYYTVFMAFFLIYILYPFA